MSSRLFLNQLHWGSSLHPGGGEQVPAYPGKPISPATDLPSMAGYQPCLVTSQTPRFPSLFFRPPLTHLPPGSLSTLSSPVLARPRCSHCSPFLVPANHMACGCLRSEGLTLITQAVSQLLGQTLAHSQYLIFMGRAKDPTTPLPDSWTLLPTRH